MIGEYFFSVTYPRILFKVKKVKFSEGKKFLLPDNYNKYFNEEDCIPAKN